MALKVERRAATCWLSMLGVAAIACAVDERYLRTRPEMDVPGVAGRAGVDDGVAGRAVTGSPSSDGGSAGQSQEPSPNAGNPATPTLPPLVNGCADLDTDGVADCTVTLVENPTFASDVESWAAVETATLAWDGQNALSDTPSGCALLTATGASDIDGSVLFRASQCVAVPANHVVIAYANARIAEGATAEDAAQAELEVSFFDGEDCSGEPNGHFFTPPAAADAWVTIQAGGLSGPGTTSASIALVGIKPYRADALSVCFDNVMVKAKAP